MISVITASLPTRAAMLAECVASIAAQTLPPAEHLIAIDHERRGPSAMRNGLLAAATGDWIAVLDDDDLAMPQHLARLREAVVEADIAYSFCEITGRSGWTPNRPFSGAELREFNYIPATALVRASLLRDLGGWRDPGDCVNGWEDWNLWLRALDAGARFVCVPEITWIYRFHSGNRTERGASAA